MYCLLLVAVLRIHGYGSMGSDRSLLRNKRDPVNASSWSSFLSGFNRCDWVACPLAKLVAEGRVATVTPLDDARLQEVVDHHKKTQLSAPEIIVTANKKTKTVYMASTWSLSKP